MTIPPRTRLATPDDAAGIARVQIDGWRTAYRGLLPSRVLADLSHPEQTALWAAILRGEAGAPGSTDLVAIDDDEVCGFVCRGPVRTERGEATDATVEVFALYVAPAHLGTGLGRTLLQVALDGMHEDGHTAAVLWVLRGNMRARRFYERGGWVADGAERASEGALGVPSVRYWITVAVNERRVGRSAHQPGASDVLGESEPLIEGHQVRLANQLHTADPGELWKREDLPHQPIAKTRPALVGVDDHIQNQRHHSTVGEHAREADKPVARGVDE